VELNQRALYQIKRLTAENEVDLTYLFGSHARGEAGPLSDIDIAVLFNPAVAHGQYSDRQARLISDLMLICKSSEIDVVVLNEAPPLLKFLVINDGRLIFSTGELVRIAFETAARREYFETEKIRRAQNEALAKRYSRFAG
jgi:uncharacterized protein